MNTEKNHRVVIATGGTGGHFYPTLSIAGELRRRQAGVHLLVAGHHVEEQLQLARERGFDASPAPALRVPRASLAKLVYPLRLLKAITGVRGLLRQLSPDVMLGMGSFASVPACLAALHRGVPLVLHEGNTWMGRANRFLSHWARVAGVALPLEPNCPVGCRVVHVGMPLRQALVEAAGDASAPGRQAADLGLDPGLPIMLIFGGSQGSRFFNDVMVDVAALLRDIGGRLQIIHLTGTEDNTALTGAYAAAGIRAAVRRADPDIQDCYRLAGLVLCRAGAASICELALFGRPAILVPFPNAAEDHQSVNARFLASGGAALHVPEAAASAGILAGHIRQWVDTPGMFAEMASTIKQLAIADADVRMANLCIEEASAAGGWENEAASPTRR